MSFYFVPDFEFIDIFWLVTDVNDLPLEHQMRNLIDKLFKTFCQAELVGKTDIVSFSFVVHSHKTVRTFPVQTNLNHRNMARNESILRMPVSKNRITESLKYCLDEKNKDKICDTVIEVSPETVKLKHGDYDTELKRYLEYFTYVPVDD